MNTKGILKTAFSSGDYYRSMNEALRSLNGNYHMLHYPLHVNGTASFAEAQENLIRYCMSKLPSLENKRLLDIGCGNGTVSLYIAENYEVHKIGGIDLNSHNISIAQKQKDRKGCTKTEFFEGDAQDLHQIPDNSIDIVLSIESAFHYPDKDLFLKEISRVLKPAGQFIIADIITTRPGNVLLSDWKKKMNFNHWSLDSYLSGFKEASLSLHSRDDISNDVIQGFKSYKKYLHGFSTENRIRSMVLKFFFIINAKLNIYLLNKKRRYIIFYGMN